MLTAAAAWRVAEAHTDTHFWDEGGQPLGSSVVADERGMECVWPTCTSRCPECQRTGESASQCIVTFPGVAACPVDQKCWLGKCSCYDGYCYTGSQCVPRQCIQGAKPPPFVTDPWVDRWNSFSFPGPAAETSSTWKWLGYWLLSWFVPALLVMLGVCVAGGTLRLLINGPDTWLCRRAPRMPIFMPLWAAVTLLIIFHGFGRRHRFVTTTAYVARERMKAFKADAEQVMLYGQVLQNKSASFAEAVHAIPSSCHLKSLSGPVIEKLIAAVDHSTNNTAHQVQRLYEVVQVIPGRLNLLMTMQTISNFFLVWLPVIPSVFEIVAMIMAILIGILSFQSPDPRIAERAVRGMKKYGAKGFAIMIVLSMTLAAIYLQTAMVTSRFCSNVDANAMGYVDNYHFSRVLSSALSEEEAHQASQDIREAVFFYIGGLGFNPLQKFTSTLQTNIHTLSQVANYTRWVQDLAAVACPAVAMVQAETTRIEMDKAIEGIEAILDAAHLWPYYHTVMHEVYCTALPRRIAILIVFKLLMGLVMLPVLALTLDVDLKRMVTYKSGHSAFEMDEQEEMLESTDEEFDEHEPAKSSMTYTHVAPTTTSGSPRHPGVQDPRRTFLA